MRIGARLPIAAREWIRRVENRNRDLISILPLFDLYTHIYKNGPLRATSLQGILYLRYGMSFFEVQGYHRRILFSFSRSVNFHSGTAR